jgi:hypothetical protein
MTEKKADGGRLVRILSKIFVIGIGLSSLIFCSCGLFTRK